MFVGDATDIRISHRQLDTLVKGCERDLPELRANLAALLQEAGREWRRLNEPEEQST